MAVTDSRESLLHRIRVFIVDDHPAVRHAVATVLAAFPDFELAGQACGVAEALWLCPYVRPDIVLMDISLPGIGSAAATRAILDYCPSSRVICTCTFQEEELIPKALSAGAVCCLLKNVSADELASAIRAAYLMPSPTASAIPCEQQGIKNPRVGFDSHGIHRAFVYGAGGRPI